MSYAVRLQSLNKTYSFRTLAVRNLNLDIPTGRFVGFFGPNGAGKTTTIQMMLNLQSPTGGTAEVLGVDSRKLGPEQLQRIGYVSENQELPGWMTLKHYLTYLKPLYPTWSDDLCTKLVDQFQLPLSKKLDAMSRGMRMKAALLGSLSYVPELVVLDEPFSGLDPLSRDQFVDGLLELADQKPYTLFLSTHDVDEVERLCDTIAFIQKGTVTLSESTETLLQRFRKIEVRLPPNSPSITTWPDGILNPEQEQDRLRYTQSTFTNPEQEEATVYELCESAEITSITPIRLRDVIVSLSGRNRV